MDLSGRWLTSRGVNPRRVVPVLSAPNELPPEPSSQLRRRGYRAFIEYKSAAEGKGRAFAVVPSLPSSANTSRKQGSTTISASSSRTLPRSADDVSSGSSIERMLPSFTKTSSEAEQSAHFLLPRVSSFASSAKSRRSCSQPLPRPSVATVKDEVAAHALRKLMAVALEKFAGDGAAPDIVARGFAKWFATKANTTRNSFQTLQDFEQACFDLGVDVEECSEVAEIVWNHLSKDRALPVKFLFDHLLQALPGAHQENTDDTTSLSTIPVPPSLAMGGPKCGQLSYRPSVFAGGLRPSSVVNALRFSNGILGPGTSGTTRKAADRQPTSSNRGGGKNVGFSNPRRGPRMGILRCGARRSSRPFGAPPRFQLPGQAAAPDGAPNDAPASADSDGERSEPDVEDKELARLVCGAVQSRVATRQYCAELKNAGKTVAGGVVMRLMTKEDRLIREARDAELEKLEAEVCMPLYMQRFADRSAVGSAKREAFHHKLAARRVIRAVQIRGLTKKKVNEEIHRFKKLVANDCKPANSLDMEVSETRYAAVDAKVLQSGTARVSCWKQGHDMTLAKVSCNAAECSGRWEDGGCLSENADAAGADAGKLYHQCSRCDFHLCQPCFAVRGNGKKRKRGQAISETPSTPTSTQALPMPDWLQTLEETAEASGVEGEEQTVAETHADDPSHALPPQSGPASTFVLTTQLQEDETPQDGEGEDNKDDDVEEAVFLPDAELARASLSVTLQGHHTTDSMSVRGSVSILAGRRASGSSEGAAQLAVAMHQEQEAARTGQKPFKKMGTGNFMGGMLGAFTSSTPASDKSSTRQGPGTSSSLGRFRGAVQALRFFRVASPSSSSSSAIERARIT